MFLNKSLFVFILMCKFVCLSFMVFASTKYYLYHQNCVLKINDLSFNYNKSRCSLQLTQFHMFLSRPLQTSVERLSSHFEFEVEELCRRCWFDAEMMSDRYLIELVNARRTYGTELRAWPLACEDCHEGFSPRTLQV